MINLFGTGYFPKIYCLNTIIINAKEIIRIKIYLLSKFKKALFLLFEFFVSFENLSCAYVTFLKLVLFVTIAIYLHFILVQRKVDLSETWVSMIKKI
jgi:hypothetical protein